jgi:hypothetical protein
MLLSALRDSIALTAGIVILRERIFSQTLVEGLHALLLDLSRYDTCAERDPFLQEQEFGSLLSCEMSFLPMR